jgi:hypothetical protein
VFPGPISIPLLIIILFNFIIQFFNARPVTEQPHCSVMVFFFGGGGGGRVKQQRVNVLGLAYRCWLWIKYRSAETVPVTGTPPYLCYRYLVRQILL